MSAAINSKQTNRAAQRRIVFPSFLLQNFSFQSQFSQSVRPLYLTIKRNIIGNVSKVTSPDGQRT